MSAKAKAQALLELYSEQFPLGDREVRNEAFTAALRLYGESGDPRGKDEILGRFAGELAAIADAVLPQMDDGLATLGDQLYEVGIRLDDPDLARLALEKALAVHEAAGNPKGQADVICRLCTLDLSEEDGVDAASARRAVELYVAAGDDRGRVYALNLTARAARQQGAAEEARSALEEAVRIARECDYVDGEVSSLLGLATVAMADAADLEYAHSSLLAARELVPKLADESLGAAVLSMLADTELATGNPSTAEDYHRRAMDAGKGWTGSDALQRAALADIAAQQGRLDSAAREALEEVRLLEQQRRRIGNARNQARWYQDRRHHYVRALGLAAAAGDGPAALEIIESQRAQALAATLDGDPSALAAAGFDLDGKLVKLLRNISTFEDARSEPFKASGTMSAKAAAGWNAMTAEALEQDHAQLADLVGTALLRRAGKVESIETLRGKLGPVPHAMVYDIAWNGDLATVHAVWVPPLPGVPTVHEILLDAQQTRWIRSFADPKAVPALLDRPSHRWQAGLASLIPERLQAELVAQRGNVELVIVPAEEMWAVPFAGLTIGAVPLVELATVALAPSLAVAAIASTRKVRRVRKAIALLDPGLRGTSVERDTLARHFRLTEVPPVAGHLVSALQGRAKFDLGVVSAHGDHVRGLAHALRIGAESRLFAGLLLYCEVPLWWVMGACWSGGLDHEPGHEPIGLPTVALLRGARGVVGALHRVPDRATGRILANVYTGLAAGKTAPAALRAAQRDYLAETGGACRLIDWAPLVSIGAPGSR
ncbi:hypothetical protein GCM10009789_35140 [Kribbella sancticallisti]|uniref:CHAT domain-containing protein n=1 Tax=Kribbella sancticallisti TaxID=460087 RepID=A0ABP4PDC8_9ACTN